MPGKYRIFLLAYLILQMEALGSCETPINIYQSARHKFQDI
jgi:hypothetical protein